MASLPAQVAADVLHGMGTGAGRGDNVRYALFYVFRFPQLAKTVPIIPSKMFEFQRFILFTSPYKGVILKMTKKGGTGNGKSI